MKGSHTFSLPTGNGTVCDDGDPGTYMDACFANTSSCRGIVMTCGNQNVTCPINQRVLFSTACIPGTSCNVDTCCRPCAATNLVTNGDFTTNMGWATSGIFRIYLANEGTRFIQKAGASRGDGWGSGTLTQTVGPTTCYSGAYVE
jgi:hypothetical protein